MSAQPIEQLVEELFRLPPTFRTALAQRTALVDVDLDGFLVKAGEHVTVYENVTHRVRPATPIRTASTPLEMRAATSCSGSAGTRASASTSRGSNSASGSRA